MHIRGECSVRIRVCLFRAHRHARSSTDSVWLYDEQSPLPVSARLCCWLFAVVAMMGEPLDPDTCSDMQAIARHLRLGLTRACACVGVRSNVRSRVAVPDDDAHLVACVRVALVAIAKSLASVAQW